MAKIFPKLTANAFIFIVKSKASSKILFVRVDVRMEEGGGSVRLLTPLKCTNIVGQMVGANCRDSCGLGTHNSQS